MLLVTPTLVHNIRPSPPFRWPSGFVSRLTVARFRHSNGYLSLPISVRRRKSRGTTMVSEKRVVVGVGSVSVDFLAAVASYPKPDDKIRSTDLKIQGGGNAGNALTCAARLGLKPRLISKVADDSQGRGILEELEGDGVNTSFFVTFLGNVDGGHEFSDYLEFVICEGGIAGYQVSKEGNSPFTYIIVDNQTKTRTCIHTPGYPPMLADELPELSLKSALDGARLVYFDVRLPETALRVANEAVLRNIPILIDAERLREGLDDLLIWANYLVCSAKFPQVWTSASTIAGALVSILLKLPRMKFVIVTLGERGCIMLERTINDDPDLQEIAVDSLLASLKEQIDENATIPLCITSPIAKLTAEGIGAITGQLLVGTAEKIPPSELVDTTGAGDAFIGATLYAICVDMPSEKLLPFATQVAAANCRALGARAGLPVHSDPRLATFS